MKLIIGLGNPGKKYEDTRHNVGWEIVRNEECVMGNAFIQKPNFYSEIAEMMIDGEKVLFVHPLTFMNESGKAVNALKQFYKLDWTDILIIHDDMDLPLGEMRFTKKAGDAGHKGVASIQSVLGTKEIPRLRIGIGRPTPPIKPEDYVLQSFPVDEKNLVEKTIHKAASAVQDWIKLGLDRAMNVWNEV